MFLGIPYMLLGIPKRLLGIPKGLLGTPTRLLGIPNMFLGIPKRLLGIPNMLLGIPKMFLCIPKRLLGIPKMLIIIYCTSHGKAHVPNFVDQKRNTSSTEPPDINVGLRSNTSLPYKTHSCMVKEDFGTETSGQADECALQFRSQGKGKLSRTGSVGM